MTYIVDSRSGVVVETEPKKKFPLGLLIVGLGVAGVLTATMIAGKITK